MFERKAETSWIQGRNSTNLIHNTNVHKISDFP